MTLRLGSDRTLLLVASLLLALGMVPGAPPGGHLGPGNWIFLGYAACALVGLALRNAAGLALARQIGRTYLGIGLVSGLVAIWIPSSIALDQPVERAVVIAWSALLLSLGLAGWRRGREHPPSSAPPQ